MGQIGPEYEEEPCFTPPEGLKLDGDSGEALVKWEMKDDKVYITAFDGVPLGDQSKESPDENAKEGGLEDNMPGGGESETSTTVGT